MAKKKAGTPVVHLRISPELDEKIERYRQWLIREIGGTVTRSEATRYVMREAPANPREPPRMEPS